MYLFLGWEYYIGEKMGLNTYSIKKELDLLSQLDDMVGDFGAIKRQMDDKRTNMNKFPADTKKFISELEQKIREFLQNKSRIRISNNG